MKAKRERSNPETWIISSTGDIEKVYPQFAEEVRKLIPFDRLAVSLCNRAEDTFRTAYLAGV